MTSASVAAAVLIGGRSHRMGEPKALLRLVPNGATLLELAAGAVTRVAGDVMLVGQADWPVPTSLAHLPRIPDGGNGAADGVIAALGAVRDDACLVVGCDMPFLDIGLLREMVTLALREGRGVVARDASGLHPLHAVWRRADLPRIEPRVAAGERSLSVIARELGMAVVDLGARDVAARWSAFNANTPADLAAARSHAIIPRR